MRNTEFKETGVRLFSEGLVGGNFGNISVRGVSDDGRDGFFITSSGSYLDEEDDLKFVDMKGNPDTGASSEWRVHHRIYSRSPEISAIVHAHPAMSVAASFYYDEIIPNDSEGKMLCPKIPVRTGEPGTEELAENIASAVSISPVAIARGHGTFACAGTLKEAYLLTSIAEHACRVIYYMGGFGGRSL
ncbi:class II aldolase/adducin family protein [Methanoplanus limicola]|uniref:Class II aldolase/adducin family protein n=1 Tax=Methanoplanus limicola DSM 2279 TaxID=937775 RepID=H1YXV9_9EURY|nr:class II aldolase/adducin family protein [Methanoplanus limicola]EHQ35958.1 class II aldolase/adducin family protein [Methanoplanus limicola DSM 2279]